MVQVTIDTDCRGARDERSVDIFGRTYEYFIGSLASSEGNRGGEFFTPSSIVQLLVAMLEPISGKIFEIITSRLIQFNDYLFQRSRGVQNPSGVCIPKKKRWKRKSPTRAIVTATVGF